MTRGGRTVGRNWGRLWRHFQNAYLNSIGSDLRVAPNPPIDLMPVPLSVVRRWRRRLLRANPAMNGRKLLVNAERERSNRDIIETIEGAMACFEQPLTENELGAFYRRHMPDDIAVELTSATIGLDYCVGLAASGTAPKWYAGIYQIHDELAVFGRAILLSARFETAADVSDFVREGFPAATQRLLVDLFAGADLVMIEAMENPETLVTDMARLAQAAGLVPVSVATAAGHALPDCVVRTVADLSGRMASKALLIVDDADALTPKELALVPATSVAGGSKVALIRRNDTDWPPLGGTFQRWIGRAASLMWAIRRGLWASWRKPWPPLNEPMPLPGWRPHKRFGTWSRIWGCRCRPLARSPWASTARRR